MTEDQQNLANAIESQRKLISEINELNNAINVRKEAGLKLQGIIEYLQSRGVTLPEPEKVTQQPDSEKTESLQGDTEES
jgi:hypothetical protein